jgi:MoaA/NifB/PqqE/SkfB family radical SAM enzyme
MNLNNIIRPKIPATYDPVCPRAKLDTGTHCNYKCYFCYYLDKLHIKTSFDIIKQRIDKLYDLGFRQLDLSGGESTIHQDWFKILEYCQKLGIYVSCLSNGSMLCYPPFIEKSKLFGLREILFSLHGGTHISHDKNVGHAGAFKKIMYAINLAINNDLYCRINTTIDEDFDTENFIITINNLNIKQLNLLPLNNWEQAKNLKGIDYHKISGHIKKIINNINDKDLEINVRYIPFCYMKGYEKYVCGIYQHVFDQRDWNISAYGDLENVPTIESMFNQAYINRKMSYTKPIECLNCSLKYICDGLEYNNQHNKVFPYSGKPVENIMEFRR